MKNIKQYLLLLALTICGISVSAQQANYEILFQSGTQLLEENARSFDPQKDVSPNEIINGHYYRLLQFYEIPNAGQRREVEAQGVQLLGYIPHRAYIAALPAALDISFFEKWNIRSVSPILPKNKLAKNLLAGNVGEWAEQGGEYLVFLQFHKNLSKDFVEKECRQAGLSLLRGDSPQGAVKLAIPFDKIKEVAALPFVHFIEPIPAPLQKEDGPSVTMSRSNVINSAATGYHFDGAGVNVAVRETGKVHEHIDFKGRLNRTFFSYDAEDGHGTAVSSIVGGAGNRDPRIVGMAPGATIYSTEVWNDFSVYAEMLHAMEAVVITNTSYGDGCNNGYTMATQATDAQLEEYPTLMHVFSAGNQGQNDCGYGAGTGWGTITGGNKQGKNCITTGGLLENGGIYQLSSWGPATDGRIKPDIAATAYATMSHEDQGYTYWNGTSFAAPAVVGVMAQLYQAYREWNSGNDPEAALIKATMLNSANDLGQPGPDFKYGWGQLNAYKALRTLEQGHYSDGSIDQGGQETFSVNVPDGISQLKVMVYWADPAATAGASIALVNNLDIQLIEPNGTAHLPLVLDPAPDPSALNAPAQPGVDFLNNMEQVRVGMPVPGSYTLQINGTAVPAGPQTYFIVYEFATDEIKLTHPIGGELFAPGDTTYVHWDAFGGTDPFVLDYSTDGGSTWQNIAFPSATDRVFEWHLPQDITGQGVVRVSRQGSVDTGSPFSVMPVPANVQAEQVCLDFIKIKWEAVPEATEYVVHLLGDKYMEAIDTVSVLEYELPISSPIEDHWIAVSALGSDGKTGRRSYALLHNSGLLNCQYDNDMALLSVNSFCPDVFYSCNDGVEPISISIENQGLLDQTGISLNYQLDGGATVTEIYSNTLAAGEMLEYEFTNVPALSEGTHEIKVWASVAGDPVWFNDTIEYRFDLLHIPDVVTPAPLVEGFSPDEFPPTDWLNLNPDQVIGWVSAEVIGADGQMTTAALLDNYNYYYYEIGEKDQLVTIPIDLSALNEPRLAFDLAKATFDASFSDTLRVWVRTVCGEACLNTLVYEKAGPELETVPSDFYFYAPLEAADWRQETADLSAFAGQRIVLVFENATGHGNSTYIDNIEVNDFEKPVASFDASATEICRNEEVVFTSTSTGDVSNLIWDFGANAQPPFANGPGPHGVSYFTPGDKEVNLYASGPAGADTMTLALNVLNAPSADFTYNDDGGGLFSFMNSSSIATDFLWDFGDGNQSTEQSPTHQYTSDGDFTVTLTVSNADCSDEQSEEVPVIINDVREAFGGVVFRLSPNPGSEQFNILFNDHRPRFYQYQLLDVHGQLVQQGTHQSSIGENAIRMDAASLAAGVYLLKMQTGDGVLALRWVKR